MKALQFFQRLIGQQHFNAQETANSTFQCPNCWGVQEWDNEQKAAQAQLQKDTSRIARAREGFILRFAKQYIRR